MRDLFHGEGSQPIRKELRPHQQNGIAMLRQSLAKGNKRVVFQLATGGGKTLTSARIIEMALAKGNRVIFTAPAVSLIDQTVEEFEAEGIEHIGVMQADHPRTDWRAPVQVASVQTLARRDIPNAALVIVDECHVRSKAIDDLMKSRPDCVFIGLSATPWAKGMGKNWQDLIIGATTGDLIGAGYLCPFRVFAAAHPDLTGVKVTAGEYQQDQLAEAMSKGTLMADVVSTWLSKGEDRPTLLFAVSCDHARALHEQFQASGVSAAYVDADTDRIERQRIEEMFRSGEVKVVCSVRTLTTGVDWPVACIIDAAPTKSEILHVQKIGRGLRVNPPWDDCIILDHAANSLRLGLVTDIHYDALDDGNRAKSNGQSVKAERLPIECRQCSAVMPAHERKCLSCGHEIPPRKVKPVQSIDAELVEVTGKKVFTKEDKQKFWSMALWLDGKRQRHGKLALGLYKSRFGVWPRGLSDIPTEPDRAFLNYETSRRIAYAKSKGAAHHA